MRSIVNGFIYIYRRTCLDETGGNNDNTRDELTPVPQTPNAGVDALPGLTPSRAGLDALVGAGSTLGHDEDGANDDIGQSMYMSTHQSPQEDELPGERTESPTFVDAAEEPEFVDAPSEPEEEEPFSPEVAAPIDENGDDIGDDSYVRHFDSSIDVKMP